MAETGTITSKQQSLASIKVQENDQNTSKFYNQFLYKAIIFSICILVIPYCSSQSPDFNNQTLRTTSWEILQLIFVGIAVSYGLFSKRSDETGKDLHGSKFDNAQSYVSGLLQVSSVFDDETESTSTTYENKVQTWNSQYYRGEPPMVTVAPEGSVQYYRGEPPMVTVAPEGSVLDREQRNSHPQIGERALFLPIRSIRSRISEPETIETIDKQSVEGSPLNRSCSSLGSRKISRSSSTLNTGKVGGGGSSLVPPKLGEKVEANIVLRSPIPWKSRSGRLEMKDSLSSVDESVTDKIETSTFRSQSFRHSNLNSNSPPKNGSLSSSSLTSDNQAQNVENLVKRNSFRKFTPPMPPPPPPPFFRKAPLMRSSTSTEKRDAVFRTRDLKRSVRSVPTKKDDMQTRAKTGEGADWWTRASSDGSRTNKYVETQETIQGMVQSRGFGEGVLHGREEKTAENLETTFIKNRSYPDKVIRENPSFMNNQTFSDVPREVEEKKDFAEDDLSEMEDKDSETEEDDDDDDNSNQDSETGDDDEFNEISGYENQKVKHNSASDGGPDVDKKADEFIARFREQIRLQRIASIRSTGQAQNNTTR